MQETSRNDEWYEDDAGGDDASQEHTLGENPEAGNA